MIIRKIQIKIKELEKITLKITFWKNKELVKKLLNKKIFEDILNSYNKSFKDFNNLKDL